MEELPISQQDIVLAHQCHNCNICRYCTHVVHKSPCKTASATIFMRCIFTADAKFLMKMWPNLLNGVAAYVLLQFNH